MLTGNVPSVPTTCRARSLVPSTWNAVSVPLPALTVSNRLWESSNTVLPCDAKGSATAPTALPPLPPVGYVATNERLPLSLDQTFTALPPGSLVAAKTACAVSPDADGAVAAAGNAAVATPRATTPNRFGKRMRVLSHAVVRRRHDRRLPGGATKRLTIHETHGRVPLTRVRQWSITQRSPLLERSTGR